MRPLQLSIIVATAALQLAACADHAAEDESRASISGDSLLTHDLQIANGDTARAAPDPTVRMVDSREPSGTPVTASSGGTVVESSSTPAPASATSASTTRSAEGYIGPSCASPALPDQRRCLLGYLAHSDASLDKNYQSLITRLKRESPASSQREPATVQRLRASQRAWLVYRDDECRRRNEGKEGPLWAPTRAQCLAEYGTQRTNELARALASRAAVTPLMTSRPASTKSSATKKSSHKRTRIKRHRR